MTERPSPCCSDPDVRLMLRTRDGDDVAFEQFVRRYWQSVWNRLFHMIGDRHEAEDLTQEAFLRVFRYRRNYRPTARFSTWLNHIVANVARNAIRSRKRRRAVVATTGENDQLPETGMETPLQTLSRRELESVVRTGLSELPDRQRAALTLQAFHRCSINDIGEIMQVTPATAKGLLSRARSRLRHKLEFLVRCA